MVIIISLYNFFLQKQNVCPEDQWEEFMNSLKSNLPTAFRITGSKSEADALSNIVKSEYFSEILNMKLKVEGKEEEEEIKPINLSWYVLNKFILFTSRYNIARAETKICYCFIKLDF